jgi:hypothetical protein
MNSSLSNGRSPSSSLQPILRIGMYGFTNGERAALEASLKRTAGLPIWRAGDFGNADAWLINGSKVRVLPDGSLRILAGLPMERALKLSLGDVDRPVAFALPLSLEGFETRCTTFDPSSRHSISEVLRTFDNVLSMVQAQFLLGATILQHGPSLRDSVYHVSYRDKLLAVLNFRTGKAGLSPRVELADLARALWNPRPPGAGDAPADFSSIRIRELAWTYAARSGFKVLPSAYLTRIIYYRQVPQVSLSWIRDSQLLLLRELLCEPATMDSLRQRTSFTYDQLEEDLTSLYYAGAITTTWAKANGPVTDRRDAERHSSGSGMDSSWETDNAVPRHTDFTVPALLETKSDVRNINGIQYFTKQSMTVRND